MTEQTATEATELLKRGWTMTIWHCFCGRSHAPWWKTVAAPSCKVRRAR